MRRVLISIACGCATLALLCGCENKLSALKRAARLTRKQQYPEAVEAYERYIELAGNSPESAYERAEAYYQIGRLYTYHLREPAVGRRAFEQAVGLRPDYADPQIHLGIMYISIVPPLPARSEAALRRALESRPEITEYTIAPGSVRRPRVLLATIEQQRGRLNEAIRQLYVYEHYSDEDAKDWHELGKLFARRQEHAKTLFYLKRAFETLDEAERGMPFYMDIRTDLIEAYINNGYLAEAQELLDESLDVLGQVETYYRSLSDWQRNEAPGLKAFLLESRRALLKNLSIVRAGRGQYDEALDALHELRILVPRAKGLLLEVAKLYAKKGDFRAAREELDKFRRLAPFDARALITEATILYEEQNYKAFLERIEDYIVASPESALPRALRGIALVKAGLADEGIAQLEALCRAHPNFSPLQLKMAEALAAAGQTGQALWWLDRAMQTGLVAPFVFETNRELHTILDEPGFPELLRNVRYRVSLRQRVHEAEDLVYRGETDRGLAALDRLRTQNPDIPFTTYALARGYVFLGRPDAAFPLLIECAKAGLFNPSALRKDGYLSELHDDPRFAEVLEAIEQPWPTDAPE